MARGIPEIIKENEEIVRQLDNNRKELIKLLGVADRSSEGFVVFLMSLQDFTKKLSPLQRNKLGRSINNAMNVLKGLKADIKSAAIDCGYQAMSTKYRTEGLKRDQDRRSRHASQSR